MKDIVKHAVSTVVGLLALFAAYYFGLRDGIKVNLGPAVAEKFANIEQRIRNIETNILNDNGVYITGEGYLWVRKPDGWFAKIDLPFTNTVDSVERSAR